MAKAEHESLVLAPRDPSVDLQPDAWPEFDLTNASVHLPDSPRTAANLLLATEYHPLTVRGQLELSDEHVSLLLRPSTKMRTNLEITDVKTFSYGQYTNGAVALWAAGKSGWYALRPSRAYKAVFQEMADAVNVWYFIADAYKEPRKVGKGRHATTLPPYSAQEIFEKYATEVMEEPSEAAEAAEKLYQHREFILSSMVAGKEGLTWGQNPLFLHLRRRFASEYAPIKRRVKGPGGKSTDAQKSNRRDSADTDTSNNSLKRKRGRPAMQNAKHLDAVDSEASSGPDIGFEGDMDGARDDRQASSAPAARLSTSKRTRQTPQPETQAEDETALLAQSSNPHARDPKRQAHHKRKSLLRLKPSKATKSISRSGKAPVLDVDPLDDDMAAALPAENSGSRADLGRKSNLQRSNGTHEDEGIDMADSHSDDNGTAEGDASAGALGPPLFGELSLRALNHQPDPVQEDTWVCAVLGCVHKIYNASSPEAQQLMLQHFADHSYDKDPRVQMVKRMAGPSQHTERLLKAVKQQAQTERFPYSRTHSTGLPGDVSSEGVVKKY